MSDQDFTPADREIIDGLAECRDQIMAGTLGGMRAVSRVRIGSIYRVTTESEEHGRATHEYQVMDDPGHEPSRDWFADVCEFHRVCGSAMAPTPMIPDDGVAMFRHRLLIEEYGETMDAMMAGDLPEIADGLADLIYVAIGTAVSYGIDLRRVWEAVQRSNMAKLGGGTDPGGKHRKPPGWTPPDIAGVLASQPPIPEVNDTVNHTEGSD